ncbi:membrane protein [Geomonas sp. Red276]
MARTKSEIFLSTVLGRPVINAQGREIGKLLDLVMVPGEHFPAVSHILVEADHRVVSVPWPRVNLFNRFVISLAGPGQNLPPYGQHEGDILLKRDILDRQIVDVNGAKVVRVNDLKLGTFQGKLCVFFVDVGLRGLLRRMGLEHWAEKAASILHRPLSDHHINWKYVQLLESNVFRLTLTVARDQLKEIHPADLALIISNIPSNRVETVLNSLDNETAGEAIHELEPELRTRIINQLETSQACSIIAEMDPDEAADVMGDLPEDKAQELLGLMGDEDADRIQELLEHEEDTAGGLMNSQFIAIKKELTAAQALEVARQNAPEVETIYYLYVLDQHERPEGVVSLKDLLVNPAEAVVASFMSSGVKSVQVDSTPDDVLEIVAKYNFIALPVLDKEGKMAGIVAVDDVLELFIPAALRRKRHRL